MPAPAIIYRGAGPWGPGTSSGNLDAPDIDNNFYELASAIVALQNDRPEPDNIASISVVGTTMSIVLTSGRVIGPIPMPFLRFDWRGPWTPGTVFTPTAVFTVVGQGIYFVNLPYTSGDTFDEAVTDTDGNPLLIKLFGFDGSIDTTYDIGFFYAGRLADQTSGYLYQEMLLRGVSIPTTTYHNAYLQEAAAATLTLPILYNDSPIGSIVFTSGVKAGTFVWTADPVNLAYRDRLAVNLPAVADATAAGLFVGIAAVRT